MFNNILLKSIQIGEKAFHVLCEMSTNAKELESLGLEIIKISQQIQADFEKKQQESAASQSSAELAKPAEEPQPEQK